MIPLFNTTISEYAAQYVKDVLDTGYINQGRIVDQFEALLEVNGAKNAVALNSGTSALHLALDIIGVKEGDEVLLPAQTFVATGIAVLMTKATPVFVDILPYTGNMDPEDLKKKITAKTKAIIAVHWAGYPCDMDEINTVAGDIPVIEDAAHALGAFYKQRSIGSISRFTAFSFQSIKSVTTGDGGALCCREKEDYERARKKRWFGIDKDNSLVNVYGEREYDITEIGYKYHMNDFTAALGVANFQNFKERKHRKEDLARFYEEQLHEYVKLPEYEKNRQSAYWFHPIFVKRDNIVDIIQFLKERLIQTSIVNRRIDSNSIFISFRKPLPNTDYFNTHQLALPTHDQIGFRRRDAIVDAIKEKGKKQNGIL